MIKKLWLHYSNSNHRGPGKVVQNLLKGLEINGVEVTKKPNQADCLGCLQHPGALFQNLPAETLMGPNLFVLPHEAPELCAKFNDFVTPSQWVVDKYKTFQEMQGNNLHIWPVGIDTETWMPEKSSGEALDCFIYMKNRSMEDLSWAVKLCKYFKLSYEIIKYGEYKEEQLSELCKRSKFAILLTGTESQGVAYMNILSTNTPCYVFNMNVWSYEPNPNITAKATSVPYFNEQCGFIADNIVLDEFQEFVKNVEKNSYNPREYILQNHTLSKGAENYYNIIKDIYATDI